MPTAGVDVDVVLDGVGYMIESYQEFPVAPLVAKVATAGADPKADDLTGPQTFSFNKWSGGMGQRRLEVPEKYLYGNRTDARESRLTLGPLREMTYRHYGNLGRITSVCEFGGNLMTLGGNTLYFAVLNQIRRDTFNRADGSTVGATEQDTDIGTESWANKYGTCGLTGSEAYPLTSASGASGALCTLTPNSIYGQVIDVTMPYTPSELVGVRYNFESGYAGKDGGAFLLGSMAGAQYGGLVAYGSGASNGSVLLAAAAPVTSPVAGGKYRFTILHNYNLTGTNLHPQSVWWDPGNNGSLASYVAKTNDATYAIYGSKVGMQFSGDVASAVSRWNDFSMRSSLNLIANAGTGDSTSWDLCVYNNNLYLARKSYGDFQRLTTAFAVSTPAAGQKAWCWTIWDNKLILADYASGVTTIKSSLDGVTWATICTVSDDGTPTSLSTYVDRAGDTCIYVGMTTGLWSIDYTAGKSYLVLDFHKASFKWNCRQAQEWQGNLYLPWRGRLLRYNGSSVVDVGPPDEEAPLDRLGYVAGITASPKYLYVAYCTRDPMRRASSVLRYDGSAWDTVWTGDTSMADSVDTDLYESTTTVFVDTYGRLHWDAVRQPDAGGAGSTRTQWSCWTTDSPRHSYPRYWYEPRGTWVSSWFTAGKDVVDKHWINVSMLAEDLNSTEYVECYYQLDNNPDDSDVDASWTYLGRFNTLPNQTLTFLSVVGKSIRFRLVLQRGYDAAKAPKVLSLTVKYRVVPDLRKGARFTIEGIKNYPTFDGRSEIRTGDEIYASILATMAKKVPVAFQSPNGTTRTVEIVGYGKREFKRVKGVRGGLQTIEVVVHEVF